MADDTVGLLDASARLRARRRCVDGRDDRPDARDRAPRRVRSLTSIMSTTGAPGVAQPTEAALGVLLGAPATSREEAMERTVEAGA